MCLTNSDSQLVLMRSRWLSQHQRREGAEMSRLHAPCRRGSPPKRAVPVALGPTQDQTSATISIRRVARLSRNVGQPDHILANPIMSHKAERRAGSGEIWFAVTKHDGVQ